MRSADRVTAALLLAFAVAFSVGALKQYQWWGSGGPGPAFMPFWLGLVMALLALAMLLRSLKEKNPGESWLPRG
ncbi:MAG TPA: tripartite tricarboxylate transporter TctB family protein, partial [Burkholderiales bacterium]|nr:tripartite tricarboxylate transporter TctB family protein [Burkholderiales bacterium]